MAAPVPGESILTLPVDLLKNITNNLDTRDEKALKLTCKRMNLLVAPPPAAHHQFLAIHNEDFITPPPRDGRSTPLPQSPMPWKQAKMLQDIEQENREVEDREQSRGMELSDTEDGYECSDDGRSAVDGIRPKKHKPKKNILNWTSNLDSAPPSPSSAHFRSGSPGPTVPSLSVTSS